MLTPDNRLVIEIEAAASFKEAIESAQAVAAKFWEGRAGRVDIAQQRASTNTADTVTADGRTVARNVTFDVTFLAEITEPL